MRNSAGEWKLWFKKNDRNEIFNKSNKNPVDKISSRQDQAEEKMSRMEGKTEKILHSDIDKKMKDYDYNFQRLWDTNLSINVEEEELKYKLKA